MLVLSRGDMRGIFFNSKSKFNSLYMYVIALFDFSARNVQYQKDLS